LAPGADEVSASIAALFDAHSQVYQTLSAQATTFHSQFVQLMNGGAAQYAFTEAANTSPLQTAAAQASVAAQVPAVSAGAVGTSAPAAPVGPLAAATPSAAAATPTPAGTPVAAAPAGSATLASANTPAGAARVVTPAYAPASSPAIQSTATGRHSRRGPADRSAGADLGGAHDAGVGAQRAARRSPRAAGTPGGYAGQAGTGRAPRTAVSDLARFARIAFAATPRALI
jgi:hypothetical protein